MVNGCEYVDVGIKNLNPGIPMKDQTNFVVKFASRPTGTSFDLDSIVQAIIINYFK